MMITDDMVGSSGEGGCTLSPIFAVRDGRTLAVHDLDTSEFSYNYATSGEVWHTNAFEDIPCAGRS